MITRSTAWACLWGALIGLAGWRGACVLAGADIDTDAYAHHMIARAILADPGDLAVHWVWLPLFHYIQVPLVAAGGTMDAVRWANVALAAALPALLFAYVRRTTRVVGRAFTSPDATALLAASFAAASPIAMQMGTTAQPEPLFALVVLGVAIAFQGRSHAAAAALLSAAVMLRYEAWASLAAVCALLSFDVWQARTHGVRAVRAALGAWPVAAFPLAFIAVWALMRRPVDGQWFGFLRQTHDFAASAMHEKSVLDRGAVSFVQDLFYYPVVVPFRVLGPALALVPFGVFRTVRQQGVRFVAVVGACLAFISLTWVMRSSLGLDRHFVAVVPLYATFAAQGAAFIADATALGVARAGQGRPELERRGTTVGRLVGGSLAASALCGLALELDIWMGFWKGSIARGWPERAAIAAYMRSVPRAATIFCDDATIEILSTLDRRRFDRHWVDDPHTWGLVGDKARAGGPVFIATWARKLRGHEQAGEIVFRAGQSDAGDGLTQGVAVMRVDADAERSAR